METPWAAFVLGLVTSLHCVGMCGPLVCAAHGLCGKGQRLEKGLLLYHGGRFLSYVFIGMLLGGLGEVASACFSGSFAKGLPWLLVVALLIMAFGWEKKISLPSFFQNKWSRFYRSVQTRTISGRMLGLGLMTPVLPCGALYLAFGAATFSGSWKMGGTLMALFTLGTIPLYALLTGSLFRWHFLLSPRALQWTRQGVALLAALLLIWRMAPKEGSSSTDVECPFHAG
jgi:sulfite exporter TauE/SafE